jgi:hypothetical protein
LVIFMAGAQGLEPGTYGFGERLIPIHG